MKRKSSTRKATTRQASRKTNSSGRSPRFSTLTPREKEEHKRGINLLSDLRRREASYSALLRKHRLTGRKAEMILGRNLIKRGKLIRASKTDRLVRELFVPTPVGDVQELVRGLPAATKLSNYYNDRDKLLDDKMSPEEFQAKWSGERVAGRELLADTDHIFRMENAGVLRFRDLYASGGYAE